MINKPQWILSLILSINDMDDECSICKNELLYPTVKLLCGHVFDYECIDRWLNCNQSCPLCRKELVIYGDEKAAHRTCLTIRLFSNLFEIDENKISFDHGSGRLIYHNIKLLDKSKKLLGIDKDVVDMILFDQLNSKLEIIPNMKQKYDKYVIQLHLEIKYDNDEDIIAYLSNNDNPCENTLDHYYTRLQINYLSNLTKYHNYMVMSDGFSLGINGLILASDFFNYKKNSKIEHMYLDYDSQKICINSNKVKFSYPIDIIVNYGQMHKELLTIGENGGFTIETSIILSF